MATLTVDDLTNASKYAIHRHRLNFIAKWRSKMPHILIDYEIRAADDADYYVPPKLMDRALAVKLTFSKRGCESMSCYPFSETAPIDQSALQAYTQTSDTAVAYGQPACYNLDRAAATREGGENEVQAPELVYTAGGKCVLVDTLSKMYLNSPYLRTEEHLIQGVDDVPGFNIRPDPDPLFPEMVKGEFNSAYCRRFGRDLVNGGCSLQWWENLIGFVLGDTIYVTFKLLANNIFSELRGFDYLRPSLLLPAAPTVDGARVLEEWRDTRDPTADLAYEIEFSKFETLQDFELQRDTKLVYTAEAGFRRTATNRNLAENFVPRRVVIVNDDNINATLNNDTGSENNNNVAAAAAADTDTARHQRSSTDEELDFILTQFIEDNALIAGILFSFGFDKVLDNFKAVLKHINTRLIPHLKRMLLTTTKRVTVKLLGETYKAAVAHQFNRMAIQMLSTMAKAMTKITAKAASVIGIVLILFTLADLVLAIWDPFGYGNMFPREFPDDLARSFLGAYFESMGETRDLIEFIPEFFEDLVEDEDETSFESLYHLLDYISDLEVNSNGQMLNFEESDVIEDFDEMTLVGSVLASSALYTRMDFLDYTQRHDEALQQPVDGGNQTSSLSSLSNTVLIVLWALGAITLWPLSKTSAWAAVLFLIFLLIVLYLIIKNSLTYYLRMRSYTNSFYTEWYKNLYN